MGMHGVVVLHPAIDESKSRSGIRDWADPDIVALEGLYESLGHAVALGAFDRGEAWDQVERHGDLDGFVGGAVRADRRHLAIVFAHRPASGMAFEKEAKLLHQPVDALGVDRGHTGGSPLAL